MLAKACSRALGSSASHGMGNRWCRAQLRRLCSLQHSNLQRYVQRQRMDVSMLGAVSLVVYSAGTGWQVVNSAFHFVMSVPLPMVYQVDGYPAAVFFCCKLCTQYMTYIIFFVRDVTPPPLLFASIQGPIAPPFSPNFKD